MFRLHPYPFSRQKDREYGHLQHWRRSREGNKHVGGDYIVYNYNIKRFHMKKSDFHQSSQDFFRTDTLSL